MNRPWDDDERPPVPASDSSGSGTGGPGDTAEVDGAGRPIGRRIVLGMLGLGAIGVIFGKQLQNAQSSVLDPVVRNDPTGLSNLLPAVDRFRYYNVADSEPERTIADYKLTVGGLVERPMTVSYADLQAMPQTNLIKDFQCVTGWRVPQVHWSGVALPDLLDHVGVKSGATARPIQLVRRRLHRKPHPGAGEAARHHRRADDARRARQPRPRRAGPALRRARCTATSRASGWAASRSPTT